MSFFSARPNGLLPLTPRRSDSDTPPSTPSRSSSHSLYGSKAATVDTAARGALAANSKPAKPICASGLASLGIVQSLGSSYVFIIDEKKNKENYKFIKDSLANSELLLSASPAICDWVGDIINASTIGFTNKKAINNLKDYLNSLFLTALKNIVESTQKVVYNRITITPVPGIVLSTANSLPASSKSMKVTFLDVMENLLSIVNKHSITGSKEHPSTISLDMRRAEGIGNQTQKETKHREIFKPLTDAFIALAFPNKEELNLRGGLVVKVWNKLTDPSHFVSIYELLIGPQTEESRKLDALKETPSGKTLSILSEFLAQQFVVKAPIICEAKAKVIGKQAGEIFASKTYASESQTENFSALVSELLLDIRKSKNQDISTLWAFLGQRISAVFSKALVNISTNRGFNGLGDDPLSAVVTKLMPAFAKFFSNYGAKLKREYKDVAARDAQHAKEADEKHREEDKKVAADALSHKEMWADEVFGELAKEILNATGIANELPPLVCHFGLNEETIEKELPSWLFSIYGHLLEDNPNLVEWLDPKPATAATIAELENTSLNGVGSSIVKGIVRKALEIVPQQADDATAGQVADIILEQITRKIPVYAAAESQTKDWLKVWIIKNIKGVLSNDPQAVNFRQFIGDHLEGVLASIFLYMATDHQPPANPLAPEAVPAPVVPNIGLDSLFKFATAAQTFTTQHGARIDAAIAAYEAMPSVTNADKEAKHKAYVELIARFAPLSNTLIDLIGLDNIRKLAVFEMDVTIKRELLPKALLGLYEQLRRPNQGVSATHENLCKLLFDKQLYLSDLSKDAAIQATIQNNIPTDLTQPQRDALWVDSGSKAMADEATRFTGVAAKVIATQTQSFLRNHDVAQLLNDFFGLGLQAGSADAALLKNEVEKFADGNAPGSKEIWDVGQYLIEMALPKILVNIIETTEAWKIAEAAAGPPRQPSSRHRLTTMPTDFIVRISKMLARRFPGIEQHIKNIQVSQIPVEQKKEQIQAHIRALSLPFVQELLATAGANVADASHPLHDLPGSMALKRKLWENLIPSVLTDLMVTSFRDIHSLDLESQQKEMRQIYGTNHVQSLSHVLAEFGKAFTPHLMATQSDELMGAISTWTNFLRANNVNIDRLIKSNIKKVGVKSALAPGWEFLSATLEPLILKFIGGLSKTFHKIERKADGGYNPDFLMDVTRLSMETIDRHITTLNLVTRAHNKSHPHEVSLQQMIIDFPGHETGHLHAAMINPQAKEQWIKALVENLLSIADIDVNTMPVPAPLRAEMFALLKNELGPRIVKSMIEEMGKEHTQNGIKLAVINNLQKACNNLMPGLGEPPLSEEERRKVNPFITSAGGIFLQVVRSIPHTLLNALQNVNELNALQNVNELNALQNVSDLKTQNDIQLGTMVYKRLKDWPMTHIMKEMVESALPSIHPGEWSDANDAFVPHERHRLNGVELPPHVIPALNFSFAPTAQQQAWQAERVQQTAQDFIKNSNTLGNTGIDNTIKLKLQKYSGKLEDGINAVIQFIFRTYSPPVQRLAKECLTFVAKIIGVVFFPIVSVLHMIQEFHVSRQVQHLNKNFSHPINENLMYQLVDIFVVQAIARKQQMAAQGAAAGVPPAAVVPPVVPPVVAATPVVPPVVLAAG